MLKKLPKKLAVGVEYKDIKELILANSESEEQAEFGLMTYQIDLKQLGVSTIYGQKIQSIDVAFNTEWHAEGDGFDLYDVNFIHVHFDAPANDDEMWRLLEIISEEYGEFGAQMHPANGKQIVQAQWMASEESLVYLLLGYDFDTGEELDHYIFKLEQAWG